MKELKIIIRERKMSENKKYKRFCIRCGEIFATSGRFSKICDRCNQGKGKQFGDWLEKLRKIKERKLR